MGKTDGFAAALLEWYDREARRLPWRIPPGQGCAEPYHVLVSEVMLQQTTVAVVEKRYPAFLDQFPDLYALAAAPEAEVLAAWAGLVPFGSLGMGTVANTIGVQSTLVGTAAVCMGYGVFMALRFSAAEASRSAAA